jgi:hypothetical protein
MSRREVYEARGLNLRLPWKVRDDEHGSDYPFPSNSSDDGGETMLRKIFLLPVGIALAAFIAISSVESSRIGEGIPTGDMSTALHLGPVQNAPLQRWTPFFSCDNVMDPCGSIIPSPFTAWIADGEHNTTDGTLFFVDVPSDGDGIFQLDPSTCEIVEGTYYSVNGGVPQKGIGYDPEYHDIYVGGWNDGYLNQYDATPPYPPLSYTYLGVNIASIAVDDADNYLFIGTNSYPDYLYLYDITGGTLGMLLGVWAIPWQTTSDGNDMAGMDFDDDSGELVVVNQYGPSSGTAVSVMERFNLSLLPRGWCDLANTEYAWGIGIIEDGNPASGTFWAYVTDAGDFTLAQPIAIDVYGTICDPPDNLVCEVADGSDVLLTWTGTQECDEVRIYRDTALIATLPGSVNSYIDEDPGCGFHIYGVTCVCGPDESPQVECEILVHPSEHVCFDFNESDGGWTPGGNADFEWGFPSCEIDGNAWETNIQGPYPTAACGWLDSPPIDLGPEGGWLTFETCNAVATFYDGWTVQISLDGDSWSCISPVEGYDSGWPYGALNCYEFLFCDCNNGYDGVETWNFDLCNFPNTTVMIRIVFTAYRFGLDFGLVLDNVCIYTTLPKPLRHREPGQLR